MGETCSAIITGTNNNDILRGTPRRDAIYGLGGDDELYGLGGDDLLNGGPDADVLDGGPGTDIADYDGASAAVTVNLGTGVHTGDARGDTYTSIEIISGSARADTLTGDNWPQHPAGRRRQ